MSNVQLYLSIGIPTFTVILGVLISLFQSNRLSDRTDRQIEKVERQIEKLSDKMDHLSEQHHKDILMLMEQIVRLNERIAKVEN